MNLGLQDKAAIVTAASGGLGYAVAKALVEEGANVAVCSRDLQRANDAAQQLRDVNPDVRVYAYEADVSNLESLTVFFSEASRELGRLDILVCNAGGPPAGGFQAVQEADWDKAYQLTLMSVVRSVRLALPHFQKSGGGSVLAITSSSVKRPIDNLLMSNVFRVAVLGLCKSLSIELADQGIRVNSLAPGRIQTERTDYLDNTRAEKTGMTFEEVRAQSVGQIPMGRLGKPEEFGKVAAFLCSDAASYISGSSILVDGAAVTCL